MRIQHNISSLNAYRNYTNNTNAVAKNLEKLSSGYRINRAGDDAAGLAISEKMRAQITGLETAQKNAADGVSLVQTAEGALTEVHSMLNRMVELADQSANGTYDNAVDRANLQKEIKDLKDEINRIADATNFNGINLLNGNLSGQAADVGAILDTYSAATTAVKGKFEIDLGALDFKGAVGGTDKLKLTIGDKTVETDALTANKNATQIADEFKTKLLGGGNDVTINGVKYTVDSNAGKLTFEMAEDPTGTTTDEALQTGFVVKVEHNGGVTSKGSLTGYVNPATTTITHATRPTTGGVAEAEIEFTKDMIKNGATLKIGDQTFVFKTEADSNVTGGTVIDVSGMDQDDPNFVDNVAAMVTKAAGTNTLFTVGYDKAGGTLTIQQHKTLTDDQKKLLADEKLFAEQLQYQDGNTKGLTLQIGDTSDAFNKLDVSIKDCHTDSLGIDDIDISTQEGAAAAVDKIKDAINYVSDVRGTLGATQNRLEHTINNLSVTTENMTAAESRIRDVDVAKEMMAYTKNNILVQSAQAMLAQANQTPQGVLQLLQ
ncbi:MAG: flagellin [Butyricicoccus pullicaecorum]|nr:flagellin [Butyricicoccus pullicaecorum]